MKLYKFIVLILYVSRSFYTLYSWCSIKIIKKVKVKSRSRSKRTGLIYGVASRTLET